MEVMETQMQNQELKASADINGTPTLSVVRLFAGVALEGREITIRLVPDAHGMITVDVIAHPILTGYDRNCRLNDDESRVDFRATEIQLRGGTLECLRAADKAPTFREGFTIALEPGMPEEIARLKPLLGKVAAVASAIERRYGKIIGNTPYLHMTDFFAQVVAAIVLDGEGAAAALAKVKADHWAGQDEQLMAPFENDVIQHLLVSAMPIAN